MLSRLGSHSALIYDVLTISQCYFRKPLASFVHNLIHICCWEEAFKEVVLASNGNWLSHLLDIVEKFVVLVSQTKNKKIKKMKKKAMQNKKKKSGKIERACTVLLLGSARRKEI